MAKAKNVIDTMTGVSLRDRFAGQALAGIVVHGAEDYEKSWEDIARASYAAADAMLAARDE